MGNIFVGSPVSPALLTINKNDPNEFRNILFNVRTYLQPFGGRFPTGAMSVLGQPLTNSVAMHKYLTAVSTGKINNTPKVSTTFMNNEKIFKVFYQAEKHGTEMAPLVTNFLKLKMVL